MGVKFIRDDSPNKSNPGPLEYRPEVAYVKSKAPVYKLGTSP